MKHLLYSFLEAYYGMSLCTGSPEDCKSVILIWYLNVERLAGKSLLATAHTLLRTQIQSPLKE